MARKKVSEDIDILNDEELELSEANEEAEELELSADESEEEEVAPAKAPKKNSRKKKEPEGLAAQLLKKSSDAKPEPELPSRSKKVEAKEEAPEEEVEVEVKAEEPSDEETPAKKSPRRRSTPEEKGLSVAMESALEAMSSHWAKAKEATDALVSNLERVKKDLEEVKQSSSEPLQMLVNQTKEKQAVASRVTFALSLAAMIFSFVSLTLSQSVRGQLLGMAQTAPMQQREQVAQTRPVRESAPVAAAVAQPRQAAQAPVTTPAPLNPIPEAKSLARVPRKAAPRVRK